MDVRVGDKLQMKKPHPCGTNVFEVLRIGADFKIRCTGCGREVMVPRHKCEKKYLQDRARKCRQRAVAPSDRPHLTICLKGSFAMFENLGF